MRRLARDELTLTLALALTLTLTLPLTLTLTLTLTRCGASPEKNCANPPYGPDKARQAFLEPRAHGASAEMHR